MITGASYNSCISDNRTFKGLAFTFDTIKTRNEVLEAAKKRKPEYNPVSFSEAVKRNKPLTRSSLPNEEAKDKADEQIQEGAIPAPEGAIPAPEIEESDEGSSEELEIGHNEDFGDTSADNEDPKGVDMRIFLATKPDKELTESNAEKLAEDIMQTPTNELSKPELVDSITDLLKTIRRANERESENLPEAEERPLTHSSSVPRDAERRISTSSRRSTSVRRSPERENRRQSYNRREDARNKTTRINRERRHRSEGLQNDKGPVHSRITGRGYSNVPRREPEEQTPWLSSKPRKNTREGWVIQDDSKWFNSMICEREDEDEDYDDLEVVSDADETETREGDAN